MSICISHPDALDRVGMEDAVEMSAELGLLLRSQTTLLDARLERDLFPSREVQIGRKTAQAEILQKYSIF